MNTPPYPYLAVTCNVGKLRLQAHAYADTGFDGGLMLPRAFVSQIQIPTIGQLTFEMVGGARMTAEIGLIDIEWLG